VTLKDIDEDVNIAIAAFQTWLNCVRAPIAACRSLVSRDLSDEHKMILGMRVWVVATLFGLMRNSGFRPPRNQVGKPYVSLAVQFFPPTDVCNWSCSY
jgi:hypothetical protein